MENGRGKGARSVQCWNVVHAWTVCFVLVNLVLFTRGLGISEPNLHVVYQSPNKRYIVTDETFSYDYNTGNFQRTCANIGAEMAVLETNVEFENIRQGVFNNTNTRSMEIYIFVDKHNDGRYHWAREEVLARYWWDSEPDGAVSIPSWLYLLTCRSRASTCKPISMTCNSDDEWSPARLHDTCCKSLLRGLCVQDVDECADPTSFSCPGNRSCVNTQYSYSCDCGSGFEMDGSGQCEDVDECIDNDLYNCTDNSTCVNTVGSYRCDCDPGFTRNDSFCVDVDECKDKDLYDCTDNSTCVNTIGSYRCECDSGFTQNDSLCVDIDECDNSTLVTCSANSTCVNLVGSYVCDCGAGFVRNESHCEDVDECRDESLFPCPTNSTCVNTVGSYHCDCNNGFTKNGSVCQDTDECESGLAYTTCPAHSNCVNSIGRYSCVCDQGFARHGHLCVEDEDECQEPDRYPCPANSHCVNTIGNYTCKCDAGFTDSGGLCQDTDECEDSALSGCPEHSICVNTDGHYTCNCQPGYTAHNGLCIDVDECGNGTLFSCQELSTCVNKDGGYTCRCQEGYFTNGRGLCEEVDKEGFKLQTCPCECPKAVTEISKDLPDAKISSEIIRKKLEVEATNLTATVRKKTSAADERGSSTTFGVIALTMLGLEGFFISLGDIIVVFFYTKQKFVEMFCPTA